MSTQELSNSNDLSSISIQENMESLPKASKIDSTTKVVRINRPTGYYDMKRKETARKCRMKKKLLDTAVKERMDTLYKENLILKHELAKLKHSLREIFYHYKSMKGGQVLPPQLAHLDFEALGDYSVQQEDVQRSDVYSGPTCYRSSYVCPGFTCDVCFGPTGFRRSDVSSGPTCSSSGFIFRQHGADGREFNVSSPRALTGNIISQKGGEAIMGAVQDFTSQNVCTTYENNDSRFGSDHPDMKSDKFYFQMPLQLRMKRNKLV